MRPETAIGVTAAVVITNIMAINASRTEWILYCQFTGTDHRPNKRHTTAETACMAFCEDA